MDSSGQLKMLTTEQYQQLRSAFFPSEQSLDWYLRQNRGPLVESGALLFFRGTWRINPDLFDAQVMALSKLRAEAVMQRGAAKV